MNKILQLHPPSEPEPEASIEDGPHLEGVARCLQCAYEYQAVAPAGVTCMECPKCHAMKSIFVYPVDVEEGLSFWRCNCGCDLFRVIQDRGYLCIQCGLYQTGF